MPLLYYALCYAWLFYLFYLKLSDFFLLDTFSTLVMKLIHKTMKICFNTIITNQHFDPIK